LLGARKMILAVSDFVTVFEIGRGSNGVFADEVFRLLIGVAAVIGGVTALILNWENKSAKKLVRPCVRYGLGLVLALPAQFSLCVWAR
jgi:hypothetical protein